MNFIATAGGIARKSEGEITKEDAAEIQKREVRQRSTVTARRSLIHGARLARSEGFRRARGPRRRMCSPSRTGTSERGGRLAGTGGAFEVVLRKYGLCGAAHRGGRPLREGTSACYSVYKARCHLGFRDCEIVVDCIWVGKEKLTVA